MSLRPFLVVLALALAATFPCPIRAQEAAIAPRPPAANPAPAHPELRPVLDEFGGEAGLVLLMDDFMQIMLQDERLRPFFEFSDNTRTKKHLVEQFCVILDGDCTYTGGNMRDTHSLLAIDRADFNALVEDLQIAMTRRNIPFRAQNKLLAKLAPMHREIITR